MILGKRKNFISIYEPLAKRVKYCITDTIEELDNILKKFKLNNGNKVNDLLPLNDFLKFTINEEKKRKVSPKLNSNNKCIYERVDDRPYYLDMY
jgi:hypothetical protein